MARRTPNRINPGFTVRVRMEPHPFDFLSISLLKSKVLTAKGMSPKLDRAVVLMSGGMDSCVTAAIAHETYAIAALHASYGQRTENRELRSFHALADHFEAVQRLTVTLD